MFPEHCKDVSIKRVEFPLTEKEIQKNLVNKPAYKRTKFIILNNEDDWAVVKIKKPEVKNLFSKIQNVKIISMPDSTKYVEDASIDVLSPTRMAEKAEELGKETLIVKGKFEHVSFIHKEKPIPVIVFEVVPPEPPKLVELVKKVLSSGNINKPVKVIPKILNLCELEKHCKNQNILFPCYASELKSDKKTFYLDQKPKLSKEELQNISLIGCDLSLRIFKTIYNFEPEFFNFCPKKRALAEKPKQLLITKCCEIKEGYERIGNLVVVPWGATVKEVEEALGDIIRNK